VAFSIQDILACSSDYNLSVLQIQTEDSSQTF